MPAALLEPQKPLGNPSKYIKSPWAKPPTKFKEAKNKLIMKIKSITCDDPFWIPDTDSAHYSLVRMIGRGAFGKVMLAIHVLTGKKVAIKSIDK